MIFAEAARSRLSKRKGGKKSMKLGGGGRFAALKAKLSSEPGVTDPGALAASIGRKKYGKARFQRLSRGGR